MIARLARVLVIALLVAGSLAGVALVGYGAYVLALPPTSTQGVHP